MIRLTHGRWPHILRNAFIQDTVFFSRTATFSSLPGHPRIPSIKFRWVNGESKSQEIAVTPTPPVQKPKPPAQPQAAKPKTPPAVEKLHVVGERGFIDVPVKQQDPSNLMHMVAPHFYVTVECKVDRALNLVKFAEKHKPDLGVGFEDIVVKAASLSMRSERACNSVFHDTFVRTNGKVDISLIADDYKASIPDADLRSINEISSWRRSGITTETNGTFTIHSMVDHDIVGSTDLVNPDQACTLVAGSVRSVLKPGLKDEDIQVAKVVSFTLACDHRVVDGAAAAMWFKTFSAFIENLVLML